MGATLSGLEALTEETMLQPIVMLGTQGSYPVLPLSPMREWGLWAAVLEDAIDLGAKVVPGSRRQLYQRAAAWIRSDDPVEQVGSFQFVCHFLGIDAEATRRRCEAQWALGVPLSPFSRRHMTGSPPTPRINLKHRAA